MNAGLDDPGGAVVRAAREPLCEPDQRARVVPALRALLQLLQTERREDGGELGRDAVGLRFGRRLDQQVARGRVVVGDEAEDRLGALALPDVALEHPCVALAKAVGETEIGQQRGERAIEGPAQPVVSGICVEDQVALDHPW